MSEAPPRLVVAGTGGDSGKTLVSLGLVGALRRSGRRVAAFKKGPDYIDAAWLTSAAGTPARNLDAWIMGVEGAVASFVEHSRDADIAVVEGNRGVFDGYEGTSTAALARAIASPVVLVLPAGKVTRTVAAFVAGVRALDPELSLAGVVLNRVRGPRHEREARTAVEEEAGVPVLGAIPVLDGPNLLPDRHLGLVPPSEHERMGEVADRLATVLEEHVDLAGLVAGVEPAVDLPAPPPARVRRGADRVRVGVFRDAAFTFYYPENIEALEREGAEVVPVSGLEDAFLPDVDLVYLGGGFPETHAPDLAANRTMLRSLAEAAGDGLPIYAECGGLIYLSRSVSFEGRRWPLSGVLPFDTEVLGRPQGHGYVLATADRPGPFFAVGTVLRGHEFHYTRIASNVPASSLCLDVRRGAGARARRDGFVTGNVFASWVHLHAFGTPEWAPALLARALGRGVANQETTRSETR